MDNYFPFSDDHRSPIAVNLYSSNISVIPHKHAFQEFVFIRKGSCIHKFKNTETTLIPGDVFIIPPHHEHSYIIQSKVEIYNCQFFSEKLGSHWDDLLNNVEAHVNSIEKQWYSLLDSVTMRENSGCVLHQGDINEQGIIHLNTTQSSYIENLLKEIMIEQQSKSLGYNFVEFAYLEVIMVMLKRAQKKQFERKKSYPSRKKDMISNTLTYIENNITEDINFDAMAKAENLSANYFRSIFKDVTGLSPIDYLNRIRIVKALEYLQSDNLSITDAAAKVGIYDSNYFSRLFKKIMGYPPKYFKNI